MKRSTILLSILILAAAALSGVWRPPNSAGTGYDMEIVSSSPSRTVLQFQLNSADTGGVEISGNAYDYFRVRGMGFFASPGEPDLPAASFLLAAGEGRVNIELSDVVVTSIEDFRPPPAGEPLPDVHGWEASPPSENSDIYNGESPFPQNRARSGDFIIMRGASGYRIRIFPARYFPGINRLEIANEFTVTINHNPPPAIPERLLTPNFQNFYRKVFLNSDILNISSNLRRPSSPDGAEMLIITEPAMAEPAESLAAWKKRSGIDAEVKLTTETGTSSSAIQSYIQNAYDTWTPAPEFLLIIGDTENVPTTYTPDDHPYHGSPTGTDLYYATTDGSDYYPDLFYGRIPVQSAAQAMNFIDKTLGYERVEHDLGSNFYSDASCCAFFQDDDRNGYADRRFTLTSEEIRDYLMGEGYDVERIYVTDGAVTPTNWNNGTFSDGSPIPSELLRSSGFAWDGGTDEIRSAINEGRFLVVHRDHGYRGGWGEPAFSKSHVNMLSNGFKLPVVMSYNCLSGYFDNETDATGDGTSGADESFCETFIRKYPGGAVGVIGATRVSYSGYNDYLAEGFIDGIWDGFDPTDSPAVPADFRAGPALNWGKIYMEREWDAWDLEFELFHWFGDPSLRIFTSEPETIHADIPEALSVGVSGCDITCDRDGALVTLTLGGEIIARNIVSAGSCHLDFAPLDSPDTIFVTITDHNAVPYLGQIPVLYAAYVTMEPESLEIMVPDTIKISVLDTSSAPYVGAEIRVSGFALSESLTVGSSGEVEIPITPLYAETLSVTIERPGGGIIFNRNLPVYGGSSFSLNDLELGSPEVLVAGSLATGIEGFVKAELPFSDFSWKLYGPPISTITGNSAADSFQTELTAAGEGYFTLEVVKEGYAVNHTRLRAADCYGPLDGIATDSSGSVDAENIDIFVYPAGTDTSLEGPSYTIETNAAGRFDAGDMIPVGRYDLYPYGIGWLQINFEMTHTAEGDYDLLLPRARTSPLGGSVTDTAGNPLVAEVVIMMPGGEQIRRTASDSSGSYSVSAIPYFDYRVTAFARGYRVYLEDINISAAPSTHDIVMTPVERNVLLIDNGGGASTDSLFEHLESMGLGVAEMDHVPTADSLSAYEFAIYSTGAITDASLVDPAQAWRLLEAHRRGVKVVISGGDIASNYLAAPSMPLVLLDSLFLTSGIGGDDPGDSIALSVSPPGAYALAHYPDGMPRKIASAASGEGSFDLVASDVGGLLYTKSGSANLGPVVYYSDSAGAGVHRMAHLYFDYASALPPGSNRSILKNLVEWLRAPDFRYGVLFGRAVVTGGDPSNIVVTGGGGEDTTAVDGRFTLAAEPGMFHMEFSAPHINDTTHYGIGLSAGEKRYGYVAILSVDDPVAEVDRPGDFEVLGAYPNPANAAIAFELNLPKEGEVELEIFDVCGRRVFNQSRIVSGRERIVLNSEDAGLTSGIYFYRLSSGAERFRGRIILVK